MKKKLTEKMCNPKINVTIAIRPKACHYPKNWLTEVRRFHTNTFPGFHRIN